jgi:cyclin B
MPIACEGSDPTLSLDMIDPMYNNYYELEMRYTPSLYMPQQTDINQEMRSILVDWIVEVHNKFRLQPLTLWLAINILDRYLEVIHSTPRSKFQLVGITSLLIACKCEEPFPPDLKDLVYITDKAYNATQIIQTEFAILKTLNYQICVPTGYHFLQRYLNVLQAPERTRLLAHYYAERNLQEYDSLKCKSHMLAAAAVHAALMQSSGDNNSASRPLWSRVLQEETGMSI